MIILDSSVWIAFLNDSDSQHVKAYNLVMNLQGIVGIPEYVLGEVCTVLVNKKGKKYADGFIDQIPQYEFLQIVYSCEDIFNQILVFFRSHTYRHLSFIDTALLYYSQSHELITFDKQLQMAIHSLAKPA